MSKHWHSGFCRSCRDSSSDLGVSLLIRFAGRLPFSSMEFSILFLLCISYLSSKTVDAGGENIGMIKWQLVNGDKALGRRGVNRLVQCHDNHPIPSGGASWSWHCPNCRGLFSSYAICRILGRISLLPLTQLPWSLLVAWRAWLDPNKHRGFYFTLDARTILAGFTYSVALTTVYNVLFDQMLRYQATSIAVLGCSGNWSQRPLFSAS